MNCMALQINTDLGEEAFLACRGWFKTISTQICLLMSEIDTQSRLGGRERFVTYTTLEYRLWEVIDRWVCVCVCVGAGGRMSLVTQALAHLFMLSPCQLWIYWQQWSVCSNSIPSFLSLLIDRKFGLVILILLRESAHTAGLVISTDVCFIRKLVLARSLLQWVWGRGVHVCCCSASYDRCQQARQCVLFTDTCTLCFVVMQAHNGPASERKILSKGPRKKYGTMWTCRRITMSICCVSLYYILVNLISLGIGQTKEETWRYHLMMEICYNFLTFVRQKD